MTARKPTPILLQQLASRRQHMARALEHLDTAIAAVRKARTGSDALAARLEGLRAQLELHAAVEPLTPTLSPQAGRGRRKTGA